VARPALPASWRLWMLYVIDVLYAGCVIIGGPTPLPVSGGLARDHYRQSSLRDRSRIDLGWCDESPPAGIP